MRPARYDWPPLTRGDTETLAVILKEQDLFTLRIRRIDLSEPGLVVRWIVKGPGMADLVRTTETGGGLDVDLTKSEVSMVLAADATAALPPGCTYAVIVVRDGPTVSTHLVGFMPVEGF